MALDETLVIERLARFEEKLDNVLTVIPDHETRLRIVEQKKEDCQQDLSLDKIEGRLDGHDDDIKDLKATHNRDDGANEVKISFREYAVAAFAIIEGLVILIQFMGGKS